MSGREESHSGGAVLLLVLFICGAAVFFYPRVSFWLAEYNQTVATQSHAAVISGLNQEEKDALWAAAIDYNRRMTESLVKDPFAETENVSPFDEYFDILDLGDGMMGSVRIPSIEVRLPIYHGTGEATLDKGVGHIKATALPIGGLSTHAVLTAHTGLRTAKMFDRLIELGQGDPFFIEVLDHTLAYRVDQIEVVQPDDISKLRVVPDRDYITLLTCTPYGINSHRLLVRGERFEYEGASFNDLDQRSFPWWIVVVVATLLIAIVMCGELVRSRVRMRRARRVGGSGGTQSFRDAPPAAGRERQ